MELCPYEQHAGLDIGLEALEQALASTEAWVARLVCRAFRDACVPTPNAASRAVESLDRCRVAVQSGLDLRVACDHAASVGAVAILQWARVWERPWCSRIWAAAAWAGSFETLEWMRLMGDTSTDQPDGAFMPLWRFASVGDWAVGNRYQWGENLTHHAARMGDLTVLKWLRHHGCPWDADHCRADAQSARVRAWITINQ
jgi:hypothetical protein